MPVKYPALLHHHPVISGQVGSALHAVDDQVSMACPSGTFSFTWVERPRPRPTRFPPAGWPAGSPRRRRSPGRRARPRPPPGWNRKGLSGKSPAHFAVDRRAPAPGAGSGPEVRRVHRHRHEAVGLGDQLPPLNLLAHAPPPPPRLADVLLQRHDHYRRKRELLYRQVRVSSFACGG